MISPSSETLLPLNYEVVASSPDSSTNFFFSSIEIKFFMSLAQSLKNLPAMEETWVRFLGREDPLEKEMATHSNILAWRTPCTEEPRGLQSMG